MSDALRTLKHKLDENLARLPADESRRQRTSFSKTVFMVFAFTATAVLVTQWGARNTSSSQDEEDPLFQPL